jgi:tetratricopeptide (TPR) repeat protein
MAKSVAGRSFLATFGLVFLAIAGLFAADTFLARSDRAESQIEATRLFQQGQAFMMDGKNLEAVNSIKDAIAIERDNQDYLRTLAEAQFAGGDTSDAETTLTNLLNSDSTDGLANLVMGRVLEKEDRFADGVSYFHRAIYGRWKQDEKGNRRKARMELIDLLAQHNSKAELLAELLPLQEDAPHDQQTRARMGELFLTAGSPARAADIFREMLREEPRNAVAHAGLGEAEFARGDYRAAQRDFEAAMRLAPDDVTARQRLDICNELLQLDPTLRGLGVEGRFRRSVRLVELTRQAITECLDQDPSSEMRALLDKADSSSKAHVKPTHESEVAEANLDLSVQLWQTRNKECKSPPPTDGPLALVMARLAQ